MNNRYLRTIGAAFLVILMGVTIVIGLSNKCRKLSQNDCSITWGLAILAILGGIVLAEALIVYRINHYEQQVTNSSETEKKQLPGRYVWFRSIIRVFLASLLLSLPIIVEGAFVATGGGLFIGFGLDFFVRGILDRLPPEY